MSFIKQSTATYIQLGPFLDVTDGSTPETGLAGSMTVYVSKAGAAYAARNSATAISHDRVGHYRVHLDATDTNTLGVLTVNVSDNTTHLDVTKEYQVVTANTFDSISGSDKLQVDVVEAGSTDTITAAADLKADVTSVTLAAATHTGAVIPTITTLTNAVTVGGLNSAGAYDFLSVNSGQTSASTGSVAKVAQGAAGGSVDVASFEAAALLQLIQDDTGETSATAGSVAKIAQGASGLDSATVTAACELAIDNKGLTSAGTGAVETVITISDDLSNPIDGVEVWITSDSAGTALVAGTLSTSAIGQATFYLDVGTYYVWMQKSGYNFTNPQTLTVVSS